MAKHFSLRDLIEAQRAVEIWRGSDLGNAFPGTHPLSFMPDVIFVRAGFRGRMTKSNQSVKIHHR